MKAKDGFTLIELLGVITIFGILFALAMPPILNQVTKSKNKVSEVNLKIIYHAVHLYFDGQTKANSTYCVTLQELVDRDLLEAPIKDFETDKQISLTRSVKMSTDEKKKETYQLLNEGIVCAPPEETPKIYQVGEVVYFDPTGAVSDCVSGKEWTPNHTGTTCYKWNVVKDNGNNIELLLDHNTTDYVMWSSMGDAQVGPDELITQLRNDTSSWNKVETLTSTDNVTRNNGSGGTYTIDYQGMKARIMGKVEIENIGGSNLPEWLYQNLEYDSLRYWTDTIHEDYANRAWYVDYNGYLEIPQRLMGTSYGVRPVVRILKSNI